MIQNFTTIQAHGRSQLSSLSLLESNKMVSIGHDSSIKMWDLRNFQLGHSHVFKQAYLTALCPTPQGILLGNGHGQLLFLDKATLQPTQIIKLHNDCINDIKIFENKIMTASSDGSIAIIDPKFTHTQQRIHIGSPLKQIVRFRSNYCLAGIRSYSITSDLQIQKQSNVSRFLLACDELYGTNDEKGLFCISKKFNTYVPCENMIEFSSGILGVSLSSLTYFTTYKDDDRISYSSSRMSEVVEGDSILSMASMGKRIFAGSECGKIYSFNVNTNYHWYDQP